MYMSKHESNRVIDKIKAAEITARNREIERERERIKSERLSKITEAKIDSFLTVTNAVPATANQYALWLGLYLSNGGEITHPRDRNFPDSEYMVPKKPFDSIPTAYGALALNLLVFEPLVEGSDFSATSRDTRDGWEYGHGRVLKISKGEDGYIATTNNPKVVESFYDVNQILIRGSGLPNIPVHDLFTL
jgi:hypothetical protein